ncbi:MAG: ABC transporter ATP-binding protein, partial [Polyangia bacterium]
MIELDDVAFAWSSHVLFQGVSLRIEPRALCGVLGPNGSGKSTLLRIVLGLLAPTRGVVRIDGADVRTLSRRDVARAIAAMLQDEPTLFPMTVTECVLLGRVARLPPHGFESREDLLAAERALDEAGVRALAG